MARISMKSITEHMRKLDFCMMVTQTTRRNLTSRPMSNNRDVTYKGISYFFTDGDSQKVKELTKNPYVILNFEGPKGLFISISGNVKLIRNKTSFEENWVDELGLWFKKGIDTPGLTLIQVKASHIRYWQYEKNGEIKI